MPARRWHAAVLALLALAIALRALTAWWTFPVELTGDERYYVEVAANLARGEGHLYRERSGTVPRALRPPAHPWLLSQLLDARVPTPVPGAALPPLLALQVLLSSSLVVLAAWLGRALFDARVGLLAAGLVAIDPALIGFSHTLWSENLFAVLLLAGLAAALRAARGGALWLLTAGALFGLGALTREIMLPVAAAVAVWWLAIATASERRRALLRGALLVTLALAVVAPWTLRNARVLGRVVPVSTVGWLAAAEGNALEPEWRRPNGPARKRFKRAYLRERGELERSDLARRRTFEMIAAEQPGWLAKKLVRNTALFASPDAPWLYKLRRGNYGSEASPWLRPLIAWTVLFHVALVAAAIVGTAGADRRQLLLLALVLGAALAVHVLANATPRYRIPWLPLLAIYAAAALARRRRWQWRRDRGRLLAATAALVFFAAVCLPQFAYEAPRTWNHGRTAPGAAP